MKGKRMALFRFFKSGNTKFDETTKKIIDAVFPNGERDINRDCARVNQITEGRIPTEKLRQFVTGAKTRVRVNNDGDESILVDSILRRSGGLINASQAYEVYAYFEGEAGDLDKASLVQKSQGSEAADMAVMFNEFAKMRSTGVSTDDLPNGYGEFGLVVTNPIPTVSVTGSNYYLGRLRFNDLPVTATRIGSTSSEVTSGMIDMYVLDANGQRVGTIYVCPYHKRNSKKAPEGFT